MFGRKICRLRQKILTTKFVSKKFEIRADLYCIRTQQERNDVEHHPGKSVGNVENGVFAEQVSDEPETFGESVERNRAYN